MTCSPCRSGACSGHRRGTSRAARRRGGSCRCLLKGFDEPVGLLGAGCPQRGSGAPLGRPDAFTVAVREDFPAGVTLAYICQREGWYAGDIHVRASLCYTVGACLTAGPSVVAGGPHACSGCFAPAAGPVLFAVPALNVGPRYAKGLCDALADIGQGTTPLALHGVE